MSRRIVRTAMSAGLLVALLATAPAVASADMQGAVRNLARSLAPQIPAGFKVGVVEFTPAGGDGDKASLFGVALADLLASELARSQTRFSVIERLQLRKLVREIETFGADDALRATVGKAGVGGIITGTYLPSGSGLLVSARVVRVDDGAVLAGGTEQMPLDADVKGLLQREFPRPASSGSSASVSGRLALDAGVFYAGPAGKLYPVKDGMTLYRADNYRAYFKANRKAHVYVVQVDSSGGVFRLFPNAEGRWGYKTIANPVDAGIAVWVPESRYLFLDEKEGREQIYFFATEAPIAELEGAALVTAASLQQTLKMMGVGGSRPDAAAVEVTSAEGTTISYETIRAIVNTRGDLMYQVWFWHR